MANAIRALAIDAVEAAKSGHPGMPMGMADVATALWSRFHKFDAADPRWPDRDRFVLSAGHGSMLLYALLYLTGHEGMGIPEIKRFRQLHSPAAGHPEYGENPAIETTTGPLGQGFGTAVGMALAERLLAARYGRSLVDHRTWVIASDGDMMEGISHEAAAIAGHLCLSKLTVLYDDNHISIDGDNGAVLLGRHPRSGSRRMAGRRSGSMATTRRRSMRVHWSFAVRSKKPTLIACRTIIGLGALHQGRHRGDPWIAAWRPGGGRGEVPHSAGNEPPFTVPDESAGTLARRRLARRLRPSRLAEAAGPQHHAWRVRARDGRQAARQLARGGRRPEAGHRRQQAEDRHPAGEPEGARCAGAGNARADRRVGADLDRLQSLPSSREMGSVSAGNFAGRYIHYGIRRARHDRRRQRYMALHGGLIPYDSTFFVIHRLHAPSRPSASARSRARM